jgi:hypothetical protein
MNSLFVLLMCQAAFLERPRADIDRDTPDAIRVIAFFGVECPLARQYAQRLNELKAEFPAVEFQAYAPNRHDSLDEVAEFQQFLDFPIQKSSEEATRLGATRSPEVFLLRGGVVAYSGRIDDQYTPGTHRAVPTRRDLAVAIREVFSGESVTVPRAEPAGCRLNIDVPSTHQAADALAIVHAKCATCHHPDSAAPFSLLTAEDARAWHATIREVVAQGRMPPWGAEVGNFANDRRLTAHEREKLLAWIDAGCPQGESTVSPEFPSGWSFTPDVLYAAPAFQVPATGTLDYQEFKLPVFSQDTWVAAVEIRGSRAVHHVNALLEPADADPVARYAVDGDDYLATMVTGNPGLRLPADMAKLIPAQWRIKLEIHYEPIGRPVLDRTAIALKVTGKPRQRVVTRMLLKNDIILPPDAVATFDNQWRLEKNYTLLAIFPHMHLRGKSMSVTARPPNQPEEVLLDVPRYDYAWQDRYELAQPRHFPAGTLIHVQASWDNTRDNPNNPDPSQTVRAGKRAIDEMFQCSFDVCETHDRVGSRGASMWLAIVGLALAYRIRRGIRRRRTKTPVNAVVE